MAKQSKVKFTATIPQIGTAIKLHGDGGARLTLDISDNDLGEFLQTLKMRGKRLRVTLEEEA